MKRLILFLTAVGLTSCENFGQPTAPQPTPSLLLSTAVVTGITDLGALPGASFSEARGINAHGQVVGRGITASGALHAALWTVTPTGVTVQDLGALGGGSSEALGINARGQVVGASTTASGQFAALWTVTPTGVTVQDLGTLPGGDFSEALGINARGQVVGFSITPSQEFHAALWTVTPTGVTVQDLGTLSGGFNEGDLTEARGINARGQVVGFSITPSGALHAALWTVTPTGVTVQDLGILAGGSGVSLAFGINARGQVVGGSNTASGPFHAALWTLR